jgi:hypothetical protein
VTRSAAQGIEEAQADLDRVGMSASESSVGNRRRRADRSAFAHPMVAALSGRGFREVFELPKTPERLFT